jgi:hypothetical protein
MSEPDMTIVQRQEIRPGVYETFEAARARQQRESILAGQKTIVDKLNEIDERLFRLENPER